MKYVHMTVALVTDMLNRITHEIAQNYLLKSLQFEIFQQSHTIG